MDRKYEVPFSTCVNGHDLSERSSYFFDIRNNRMCKECARQKGTTAPKRKNRTFG